MARGSTNARRPGIASDALSDAPCPTTAEINETEQTAVSAGRTLSYWARLRQKTTPGRMSEHRFEPRRYPVAIGGSLGEWIHAIPARGSFTMSAEADDFWVGASGRVTSFAAGAELSLRLTILDPRPEAMLLASWSGTLTSNSCTPSSDGFTLRT